MWLEVIWQIQRLPWVKRAVRAQSTVEYALVGALVVIAAAAAMTVLGSEVTAVFNNISNTLRAAATH